MAIARFAEVAAYEFVGNTQVVQMKDTIVAGQVAVETAVDS